MLSATNTCTETIILRHSLPRDPFHQIDFRILIFYSSAARCGIPCKAKGRISSGGRAILPLLLLLWIWPIKIFKAMVRPYMEYIFFTINPCTDITKLQRLQIRGLRICLRAAPRTSVLKLHSTAKLLTVRNIKKLNTLKQMLNCL